MCVDYCETLCAWWKHVDNCTDACAKNCSRPPPFVYYHSVEPGQITEQQILLAFRLMFFTFAFPFIVGPNPLASDFNAAATF
jgi:hypothetical protein